MGFFDEFEDGSGLSFVGKEEKEVLIAEKATLAVVSVSRGETKFGERFVVKALIDGEERALSFGTGSVESRDRLLDALMSYLKREDAETPVLVHLERAGRSILIREGKAE